MLPYCKKLLTDTLLGDNQKYLEFKSYLALSEAHAPSPQQIADFLFKEHTFAEFMTAYFKFGEIGRDIVAWYQNKDFVLEKPVDSQLKFLAHIHALISVNSPPIKIVRLTKIIDSKEAEDSVKALAYYYRAIEKTSLRKVNPVLEDYAKAIELTNFMWAVAYRDRGRFHFNRRDYDLARLDYDRSIALDSNDSQCFFYRGQLNEKRVSPKNKAASHDYLEAYRLATSGSAEQQAIRDCIFNLMRFDEGRLESLTESSIPRQIQINPNLNYSEVGHFHFDRGAFALAENAYAKAIELNPEDVGSIYMRAVTRAQQGKMQEALYDFLESYRFLPANLLIRKRIIDDLLEEYPKLNTRAARDLANNYGVLSMSISTLFSAVTEKKGKKRKLEKLEIDEAPPLVAVVASSSDPANMMDIDEEDQPVAVIGSVEDEKQNRVEKKSRK